MPPISHSTRHELATSLSRLIVAAPTRHLATHFAIPYRLLPRLSACLSVCLLGLSILFMAPARLIARSVVASAPVAAAAVVRVAALESISVSQVVRFLAVNRRRGTARHTSNYSIICWRVPFVLRCSSNNSAFCGATDNYSVSTLAIVTDSSVCVLQKVYNRRQRCR